MPIYQCQYTLPSESAMLQARRNNAAKDASIKPNPSGCAKAESCLFLGSDSAKAMRVTRELIGDEDTSPSSSSSSSSSSTSTSIVQNKPLKRARTKNAAYADSDTTVRSKSGLHFDHEELEINVGQVELMTKMYRTMKSVPTSERLVAKRSHVHGWGLFVKLPVARHDMIVEYMGETVRSVVADLRELEYEKQVGSCYLFRLDKQEIVDATRKGSMARFINHSCVPNAYAKVVNLEGGNKKIVFFAFRDLDVGEEVFYDYKFPIEEDKIPCHCGAPQCRRFLN